MMTAVNNIDIGTVKKKPYAMGILLSFGLLSPTRANNASVDFSKF